MLDFFANLFNTSGFPARWHCGNWTAGHGWLHILSDVAIFGAYVAIPFVLGYFTLHRRDLPFPRVLWLFVAFIFACGFGHLLEAIIFWQPVYRFAGVVKLFTAVVSWGTVVALVGIVPKALQLPGLAKLNDELRAEVEERKRAESALRQSEEKLADLLQREREARGEAERANRLKDEFVSTVSHELRTPLSAILGYAQLMLRNELPPLELECATVIERNAKAQAQIIDDLLDMARIMSGKVRLDMQRVDLVKIVNSAIATVRPAAHTKGVQLAAELKAKRLYLLGDSGRLQQIIWNLLTNAVKFTPEGGRVTVQLNPLDNEVELRIADTGQGIEPTFLPYVFDRFRQADGSNTRKHGGLGLGLAIVKHLVELHHGSVGAESAGPGQGATFVVRFPIDPATAGGQASSGEFDREAVEEVKLAGVRVLVVDDEPDARDFVRLLLTDFQAEVTTASSMEEALAHFHRSRFDVLISDIGMPGQDGYALIRAIRMLPEEQGGKIPASALTAMARTEDRRRAMLAGFQAHVAKPVDAAELVAVVATLSGRTGR